MGLVKLLGNLLGYLNGKIFGFDWYVSLIAIIAFMLLLAIVAYAKKSLDASGAFAAVVMGVIVLWTTKLEGFLLFLLFFVGANIAGRVSRKILSQSKVEDAIEKKGSRRDLMQVLANGLMATLAALIWYVSGSTPALVMFGASIAEAASDTLAGDIGRLSKRNPVSIRNFLPVPKGLSGGVTPLGTLTAFISSFLIGLVWFLVFFANSTSTSASSKGIAFLGIISLTGFMGCIIDSYLGACVQAHYIDPDTGNLTEKDKKNGVNLELAQGLRWVDNDMVNLLSNVFSSVFALGMASLF